MLYENYAHLYQFFTGYFPEADLDGLTDTQVVALYITENEQDVITSTHQELLRVMTDTSVWNEIAEAANRYFENEKALQAWLAMIAKQFTL
ncbi:hypothetical protein ACE939_12165 [Aquimarina sp. W85]|uniref:hypothetical protein n=1 Tax=Aquimarina rhodophyticola TaxID=3342246 RepID=UPI0036709542